MKVRLDVSENCYEEIRQKLQQAGFEVTENDDEQFILHEKDLYASHLALKDDKGERLHLPIEDVIFMESYGHTIEVVTMKGRYQSSESLRRMSEILDPAIFLRISNSTIINRRHLKEIIPGFSMKFRLRMADGSQVEVTRSYYNAFREFFKI